MSFRAARPYFRSALDTEDVAQEALLRAWRHRTSCRNPEDPAAWVAAIARREALRELRERSHARAAATDAVPDPALTDELEAIAARVDLERVLGTLSRADQRLLELRYTEDLTQPLVAAELGLPEGTVKVRLHRIRKLLEALLR